MCVRTTIEFDPDVAAELSRRRGGHSTLREDVNRLLRLGLARERDNQAGERPRFSTPTFDSGEPLFPVDDVEAAIRHADGEDHR